MATEITRIDGVAYGVKFAVCRNAEVARLALDCDSDEEALSAMSAAGRALDGYDYDQCSDFRAYNGGPRRGLIDPIYYIAEIDEDGERGDWRTTWQSGAGATEIPAEVTSKVDALVAEAYAAAKANV